jgi:hypothetical protein
VQELRSLGHPPDVATRALTAMRCQEEMARYSIYPGIELISIPRRALVTVTLYKEAVSNVG